MIEKDKMEYEGIVIDSCKGIFKVKVSDTMIVTCTLSGKIKVNSVRILMR